MLVMTPCISSGAHRGSPPAILLRRPRENGRVKSAPCQSLGLAHTLVEGFAPAEGRVAVAEMGSAFAARCRILHASAGLGTILHCASTACSAADRQRLARAIALIAAAVLAASKLPRARPFRRYRRFDPGRLLQLGGGRMR